MNRIKLILFFLLVFPRLPVFAQYMKPSDVPSATRSTLEQAFPNVQYPVWKCLGGNAGEAQKYEATFADNDIRLWVTIDGLGYLLAVEKKLDEDSIPDFVFEYAFTNYKFKAISEARKIYLSDRTIIVAILRGSRIHRTILFDSEGKLIADKSNALGYVFSLFGAAIIGAIGNFQPYVLTPAPAYFDYNKLEK